MSIQQLALLTPELSEEEQHFNTSLHRALHSMCDASKRWAKRQNQGLSDQDLRKAIAYLEDAENRPLLSDG